MSENTLLPEEEPVLTGQPLAARMRPSSLDEIAGALYVNKNYLARVFHKQTGQTLLQYHNRLRCEKACQLLTDRSYSISVVAFKTGFASASHFSRIFRIYEGCTPSQYRRMILKNKTD